jgi:hypothetical protein
MVLFSLLLDETFFCLVSTYFIILDFSVNVEISTSIRVKTSLEKKILANQLVKKSLLLHKTYRFLNLNLVIISNL